MFRLLYVSRSLLPVTQADDIVKGIVAVSNVRNAREGITGALMFTGVSFAQILEGGHDAVLALMADIARDERHRDVWIAQEGAVQARRFDRWSMAYWGCTTYAKHLVDAVRQAADDRMHLPGALSALSLFMRKSVEDRSPA